MVPLTTQRQLWGRSWQEGPRPSSSFQHSIPACRSWKCSFPGILLQPQAPCACHISHVLSSFPALSRAVQCLTTLLNPWNDFLQVAQTQWGWGAAECGTAVTFLCSLCLSSHPSGHKLPVRLPSPTLKETVCSHSQRLEKSHVGWINDYQASAKGFL